MTYTEAEIRELLKREEGQFLEFKSLWDRTPGNEKPLEEKKVSEIIADCVAAFSNADGGDLVLGVEDDGSPSGHGYAEESIAFLLSEPMRRLRPTVQCATQRIRIDEKELILVSVPPSVRAVMIEGNGFPYRVGDSILREREEIINARKDAYRQVGYERMIRRDAALEDIDLELVRAFSSRTVRFHKSPEENLERYGLIQRGAAETRVTNAALLLFGKPPAARWHPHADVRFFRVDGKERRHGAERNVTQLGRMEFPLVRLIEDAHGFARGQIRMSERLHDLFFKEIPEYPEFAWQEAIVNAVAHRDYGNQTVGTEIWFYEDRMEVLSPGLLIPPVTLEGLRRRQPMHASRNPMIVRVLVDGRIMREEGEGIPRMFSETESVLLKPPEFCEEAGSFKVTLRNTPVFEGAGPEWRDIVERLSLTTEQKRILLHKPEGFTNQDYRDLNREEDRDRAYREIQDMVGKGYLSSPGKPGKGAVYRLAPAILQNKLWMETRIHRLKTAMEERGSIKNADYRDLFGVTRSTAVDELQRLVDEGYMIREGERKAAQYRAGPRLAEKL